MQQLTGYKWLHLCRPLIKVHADVEATGLFVGRTRCVVQDRQIQRLRGRSEESVRVEVGALDIVLFDDRVSLLLTQTQWERMPVIFLAVDHGPLVQAETVELGAVIF